MMQHPMILLHEEALRITHPVFLEAQNGTHVIYIWDDAYFKRSGYSLKRLVFIYETLCDLDITIIRGDTLSILQEINPSLIYIPCTNNPLICEMINSVREVFNVNIVSDEPFVILKKTLECQRFFQYWTRAEKKAFLYNGGKNT